LLHIDLQSCLTYFAGDILADEEFLIESEVLGGRLHEVLPSSDDLAVKGVDNWIGFLEKAIDSAYFLEVEVPLRGMLDHDPDIDIFVFAADPSRDFFALY
jgi:hypothetical protein